MCLELQAGARTVANQDTTRHASYRLEVLLFIPHFVNHQGMTSKAILRGHLHDQDVITLGLNHSSLPGLC